MLNHCFWVTSAYQEHLKKITIFLCVVIQVTVYGCTSTVLPVYLSFNRVVSRLFKCDNYMIHLANWTDLNFDMLKLKYGISSKASVTSYRHSIFLYFQLSINSDGLTWLCNVVMIVDLFLCIALTLNLLHERHLLRSKLFVCVSLGYI